MILDIITCLLVAFGFYQGFSSGLIKTVFASLSLLVGIVAALKLSGIAIDLLQNTFNMNSAVSIAIGFVLTFIVVMLIIRFIGNKLQKLVESVHIGGINKLLGGLMLSLFYAILISYGVYLLDKITLIPEETKTASFTYPMLEPLPRATQGIGEALRPVFSEFWDRMIEAMDDINEKSEGIGN